ncbi:hypothetical protein BDR22DRAFT_861242 [Usnea florida]
MPSPVPLDHRAIRPETVCLINTLAHQALLRNGRRSTYLLYADGGTIQIIPCTNFEDRGQAVHLVENTVKVLDLTDVSELERVNEEAEEKHKRVLAELATQQEPGSVNSRSTAKDLSEIHTVAYSCTVSTFQLVPGVHEMHRGAIRGDTRLATGSIADPNEHREQHHQASEDEMQGTTEETEDAPEGSGANINVELGCRESRLPEARKDSKIGAETFKKDILILGLGEVGMLLAVANLDTLCDDGNWISHRLVCALGRVAEISPSPTTPQLRDANGKRVGSCGSISLSWKMYHNGVRWHKDDFFVLLPEGDAYDVIFGGPYLSDKGWVYVNEGAMLPMTEHKQKTAGSCCMAASVRD